MQKSVVVWAAGLLGLTLVASGWRHPPHGPVGPRGAVERTIERKIEKKVEAKYSAKDLDHQHKDKKIVIVHEKKHLRGRNCWPHDAHWHCR